MRDPLCRLVALMIAVVTLAGCSPDQPEVKPGTCLAKETTTNSDQPTPDLTSIVPCTSPHRYEVYDVVALPSRAAITTRAQQHCTASLLRVTGYDSVKVNGRSAAAVGLVPALRGIHAPRFVITPELPGQAGRRDVICTARMTTPAQAAGKGALLLSVAKTRDLPVALRPCRAYNAARTEIAEVPCSERHVSEMLFFFEAETALGKRFVTSLIAAPTAAKFDRFDQICTEALPYLLGKAYDKRLRGLGSVARRWTDESKPVRCDVGPKEYRTTDLPPGSLVGTKKKKVDLAAVPVDEAVS